MAEENVTLQSEVEDRPQIEFDACGFACCEPMNACTYAHCWNMSADEEARHQLEMAQTRWQHGTQLCVENAFLS